jgi:quercetin dioxygenase-like cupin family protein
VVTQRPYFAGDVFGQTYTFAKRGEGLPMHAHQRELQHNVIVLHGAVSIYGPAKVWRQTLLAGDVFTFKDPGAEHEICALRDDTKILNLYLYGLPDAYADLTAADLSDEFSRPLTIPE